VPGYWGRTGPDFQWISGYWADAQVSEIEYLPEPPATVEAGPNTAAPSADQIWLPGSWVWHQNRYAWRPGFWSAVQPDWVWIPAHYVYTPRGYIFVEGYWDYPVARRGVLFAPVYFSSRTYARRGFSYSPTTVISLGAFVDHLFMRPRYQHYYFGDYYAANYYDAGYYPSYSVNSSRYGYDPIFAHERWRNRQDGAWEQRVAATYQHRRDHAEARPPRIWTSQGISGADGVASAVRNLMGASLDQASRSQEQCLAIPSRRPSRTTKTRSTRAGGPTFPRSTATLGNPSGRGCGHRPRSPRRADPHETSHISDCGQADGAS
jgi:hypothetical protein